MEALPSLATVLLLATATSALPYRSFFPEPWGQFQPFAPQPRPGSYVRFESPPGQEQPDYFRDARDVMDNAVDSANGLIAHLSHLEGQLFGLPDNETGAKVAQWHEGMGVNPEELGEYAEGDILYPASMGRNGVKAESARWPGGVVPYMISPFFSKFSAAHLVYIEYFISQRAFFHLWRCMSIYYTRNPRG